MPNTDVPSQECFEGEAALDLPPSPRNLTTRQMVSRQAFHVPFLIYRDGVADTSSNFVIPKELLHHVPTGGSVLETDSVLGISGRTYHGYKEGKYFLPNDAAEQDRLDFQHAGVTILLGGKLSWAPFTISPNHVLDVATGTGIWAIEFAQQNPSAKVVGTDLSAIQPDADKIPPNCNFIKEDSEEEWLFPHKFDYIHLRFVFSCFDDAKRVFQHAVDNLNPGGWIEYHDTCPTMNSMDGNHQGSALDRWSNGIIQGAAATSGRDITVAEEYKHWMIEAGLIGVKEKRLPWPCSPWPQNPLLKQVGKWQLKNIVGGVRGIGWKMLRASGMPPAEIEQLTNDIKAEIQDPVNRFFGPIYVVYGRKPLEGELVHSNT
ncbi:S-adenosyl-L-methionine-dependent methyltransferase [Xylariales sp. AK1849]|nr:S-adenosyl-L-methionine-dependent methyltransferase [Xylariales sp. AK1849]